MKGILKKTRNFIYEQWQGSLDQDALNSCMAENCIFQYPIGKKIGLDAYACQGKDWFHSFPDFKTSIKDIDICENTAICELLFEGTHLNLFQESASPDDVLVKSNFGELFGNLEPAGAKINISSTAHIIFFKNKIQRIIMIENVQTLYQQLGMNVAMEKPSSRTFLSRQCNILKTALHSKLTVSLSELEMVCVALRFNDFNAKQTATFCNISSLDVQRHLENSYLKLGCTDHKGCIELMLDLKLNHLWYSLGNCLGKLNKL